MKCLFCATKLEHKILDLGYSPLANAYRTAEDLLLPETNFPLKVYVCHKCFLVQLYGRANPKEIFNDTYAYISSSSLTWQKHCSDYAAKIIDELSLTANDLVMEAGCNDGLLLQEFMNQNIPVLGIDPALTATTIATENKVPVISDFFTKSLAAALSENNRKASLLIGNNVLAHVPDINDFVSAIAIILKEHGICTLEFPYLPNLFSRKEFDTIYHEHFFYFSLTAINSILQAHQLQLFDAEKIEIHGGSLRIYLQHKATGNKTIKPIVQELLSQEISAGIKDLNYYMGLQENALIIKKNFITWLMQAINNGKKIMAYGAAAKGNTFLNYCGIKSDLIPMIADVTTQKQGKYLPGSHLPVVSEAIIKTYQPDYIIILPWNFKSEINNRLDYIHEWGGKLVYFIPEFELV